ncbi:Protein of unknown function DUF497 [Rhodopseudomonas palustris HaA2]|uniref:BrnT family toxin n=1 Tax=Rhodopseudomonas palustris (strain HaA2) TaxID=316058 RepID=Q2IUB6_RHOP2|nr:BrnT family toxin [Rhodopseudomonas palustris]ABD08194.1 Protein of unknown function DUF497 [Rhodopseudomonas palustris HaA2]
MKILWDEHKRVVNLEAHGLDFADLDGAYFESAVIRPSYSGRYLAFGRLNADAVAVVFKPLGREAISVISLRPANRRERELFDG